MTGIEKSTVRYFQLRSYTPGSAPKGLNISGWVGRRPGSILLEYRVEGALHCNTRPSPSPLGKRRHELWRETCFEFFFGIPGEPFYWEGNISPSGDWNVYYFSHYREEMQEEAAVSQPDCHAETGNGSMLISCDVDIRNVCPDDAALEVGIACVIADDRGAISYWAIDHCGSKPDFHDRRSFLLELAAIGRKNSGG